MLWSLFALLTGGAVFAILWPLARPARREATAPDVAFYQAKLEEIARDQARANLAPEEAALAKTEAARQLLAVSGKDPQMTEGAAASPLWHRRLAAVAALVFVPAVAIGFYATLGHPDWPDAPLEARLNAPIGRTDINAAIARVEQHLAKNPKDGLGYQVLAQAYLLVRRPADAVSAAQMAAQLRPNNADTLTVYGETLAVAAGGIVTADSRKQFEKALAVDPGAPKALFFLGLAAQQENDRATARSYWQKLLAEAPANAPWRADLLARLAQLGDGRGVPASDQAARIAGMAPAQQQAMIQSMVDGLAARLAQNGNDIEGWVRLVRAYKVLNEVDKARAALATARHDFTGNAAATARIDALAHELGLES
ncbi:c-type cytochrome biogenesis protein CcmI [Methylovirgula ligni]|uniref:Cytochrome c-type biogenesis protein CcmH n=2 Tax=Methylovirgula ligni TaxID=569860 RepID=A0A3D9YZH1_9HYPH|nr:c-type cytochrome biogenesis protein CcmI [Methylovirgula ligni]QAY97417.1 c-type cytochrome biogenesis protein CcmI [Methylovirgula ligni]REF88112.1 cytochrome c-type biogenesis protein CcmH [Methylovirgula ligni]